MPRILPFVCVLLLLFVVSTATAQTGRPALAWDPNPEPDIAGYFVEYGTTPGVSTTRVDVGPGTFWALPHLEPSTTYYFAVRAYTSSWLTSERSAEVSYKTPPRREMFWRNMSSGAVARWRMDGAQQIDGELVGPDAVEPGWRIVGAGDFNNDGKTDLVWQHLDGRVSTWLMNGATLIDGRLFQPGQVADTQWQIVAVADMDGDGQSDLVWRHAGTGMLAVWFMSGTVMRHADPLDGPVVGDLQWTVVGAGDFNGDGEQDILWRHDGDGSLAVWLMHGIHLSSAELLSPPSVADPQWHVVGVTNLTNDDWPDIIWQHDDGRLSVWEMNGLRMVSGYLMAPESVSDTNWRIVGIR